MLVAAELWLTHLFCLLLSYHISMSQIHHAAALSPRPLPHIPHEVLAEIAEYLDLPSAQNLSRSCKSLRDAGEMRVWRLVDITSGWDGEWCHFLGIANIADVLRGSSSGIRGLQA